MRKIILRICVPGFILLCFSGFSQEGSSVISGVFSVLTYNVAGLPEPLSGSQPIINSPQISEKLNKFDIVLCQEDFAYHRLLISRAKHPYIADSDKDSTVGDGLSRFSIFPFSEVKHIDWEKCWGYLNYASDCMTKKGFAVATHKIAPGVEIDIYDLHHDAGDSRKDLEAKAINSYQLIKYIQEHSADKAVIVAGDFNLERKDVIENLILEKFEKETGLVDACEGKGDCLDQIDHIFYRGNERIKLKVIEYKVELETFKGKSGNQLSDHPAVSALIRWELVQ